MSYIKDLVDGERLHDTFLVTNMTKGVTGNNQTYFTVTFQDKTGTIEGKKWEINSEDADIFAIGNIVELDADVIFYRNGLQLKIISGRKLPVEGIDIARYTIASPIPQAELEAKLKTLLQSIKDPEVALIVNSLIERHYEAFVTFPAAVRNHHEFANGLLYHTLSMAGLADLMAQYYSGIDRDILIGGVLLHDLGKVVELSGPIITKYTTEGKLLGHISICASEIHEMADELNITSEVPTLLEHMVLAHHGHLEYGSPVLPLTREALLLSFIDDIDAKMMILDKAFEGVAEGEFTSRIWPLNDSYFYKPKKR